MAKRNNRDDFDSSTIENLAKRVTYTCSNPECRKVTVGPNSDKNKSTSIGVAAHIKAAAPGGKRYDAAMTSEERKDISNGIWLCQSCSKLIDTDESKYTVELLFTWKEQAEKRAEKGISTQGKIDTDIFEVAIDDTLSKELEITVDSDSTVLTRKMRAGEFDNTSIINAKTAKIHALNIIRTLKTTAAGRTFLNQIYSEIKTVILNKYYMNKSGGDLIKPELPNINDEMEAIASKYQDKACVDLEFLMGLIYIATSNCAMRWKYGEDFDDEIDN